MNAGKLCAILFASFCIFSGAKADPVELNGYSIDEIVDVYVTVALRLEVDGRNHRLGKWPDEVEIGIYTIPSESMFGFDRRYRLAGGIIAMVANDLGSRLQRMRMFAPNSDQMLQKIESGDLQNPGALDNSITVVIGNRSELKDWNAKPAAIYPPATSIHEGFLRGATITNRPLCYGITLPRSPTSDTLWRGWLFLEDTDQLTRCAYEELMQAFGLFNDLPPGSNSIFNDDGVYGRPTDLDWLLWKLHFDARLVAGMDESSVRAKAMYILEHGLLNP